MTLAHKFTCLIFSCLLVVGCSSSSQTSEGAKQGAKSGAIGGAVAGALGSLLWGGNVVQGAAQGAAIGAASGAAVGAAQGADKDKKLKQRWEAEMGEKNFQGFIALAECNYDQALVLAKEGQAYKDRYHALAGLWLEAVVYADQQDYQRAEALYPAIEQSDPDILDRNDAERQLRDAVRKLRNIRFDHGRQAQCEPA